MAVFVKAYLRFRENCRGQARAFSQRTPKTDRWVYPLA